MHHPSSDFNLKSFSRRNRASQFCPLRLPAPCNCVQCLYTIFNAHRHRLKNHWVNSQVKFNVEPIWPRKRMYEPPCPYVLCVCFNPFQNQRSDSSETGLKQKNLKLYSISHYIYSCFRKKILDRDFCHNYIHTPVGYTRSPCACFYRY